MSAGRRRVPRWFEIGVVSGYSRKDTAGINPMNTEEKPTTSRCNKLHELPPVATDWQQAAWCPACDYYDCGLCGNPIRRDSNAACPFDAKALPLREVPAEPNCNPQQPADAASCKNPKHKPVSPGLEKAIMHQIMQRTGARIQMLEVERVDNVVIIRGYAPCYYVKQLALQGAFDVLGSFRTSRVELNVYVREPTMSVVDSQ